MPAARSTIACSVALLVLGAAGAQERRPESRAEAAKPFAQRVAEFHAWFAKRCDAFAGSFSERDKQTALATEMQKAMDDVFGHAAWEFGPGPKEGEHALILAPEGDLTMWLLGRAWAARATGAKSWAFLVGKPAEPVAGLTLQVEGVDIACDKARVQCLVDRPARRIRVRVHHPAFATCGTSVAKSATFLMLDAALGEAKVETCIGGVKHETKPIDGETIGLADLRARVDELVQAEKWPADATPDAVLAVKPAQPDPQRLDEPRRDIVSHRFRVADLLGPAERVQETVARARAAGAEYVFLRADTGAFDRKSALAKRDAVEALVEKALAGESLGACVGCATGIKSCYADLLLFDVPAATAALESAFAESAAQWVELHRFAADGARPVVRLKGSRSK